MFQNKYKTFSSWDTESTPVMRQDDDGFRNLEITPELELEPIPLVERLMMTLKAKVCYLCLQRETKYLTPDSEVPVCMHCADVLFKEGN